MKSRSIMPGATSSASARPPADMLQKVLQQNSITSSCLMKLLANSTAGPGKKAPRPRRGSHPSGS